MDKEHFYVRVKARKNSAIIKFTNDELNFDEFIKKVFGKFHISCHTNFHVKITDHEDFAIEKSDFTEYVKENHEKERFFVNLVYQVDFHKTTKIVTPFVSTHF